MREFLSEQIAGTKNFTWAEALYLPRWNIHVLPPEEIIKNIENMAEKAQKVRDVLATPMLITSWYRPPEYNGLIGGATKSWHMTGGGCDFRCPLMSADEIRGKLKPYLEEFGLRMENLPGSIGST